MNNVQIPVSDKLISKIDQLVESGWFANRGEVAHMALAEFVHRHHFNLIEQFQEADIEWALRRKKPVE